MGTTSSSSASLPSGSVINLNSGSKIQAYIPKPPKKTVVGIIFLVDPKLGFGSASSRGLAEELSAQAEFLVLCPDLTMYREAEGGVSPDQAAAMIHEAQGEIEDSVNELKRRGALRIGIVGFGQAANLAITCTAKSGIFLASCLFCGDVNIGYLSSVETPVLGVFCGNDESVPTSRAAAIGSALKTLSSKGVPTRLKLFEDQTPDFVEAESPATEAAVDEMCDFFSEFLDVADSEEWRIENFLKRPPQEEDWWGGEGSSYFSGEFQQVGFTNWEAARHRWKKHQVPKRPPRPPLVSYEAIVEGFAEPRRNFELPGRMSLSNMVSVLVDVWELED